MKPPTNADEHLFKAEELEVEAEVLEAEVLEAEADQHETKAQELIQEEDVRRRSIIEKRRAKPHSRYRTRQERIEWGEPILGSGTEESNAHEARAEKLLHKANRLRVQAALHRRKAKGN